jgi:ankyrin repeat protein
LRTISQLPSSDSLNAQANARSAAKRHYLTSQVLHNAKETENPGQFSKFSLLQGCGYSPEQISFMSVQAAAKILDPEKLSALISSGASLLPPEDPGPPSIPDRTPPLFIACRQKGTQAAAVVELLLRSGVDANAASPTGGQTALHIAAGGSDAEVVGALLAGGADISLRTQARGAELSLAPAKRGVPVVQAHTGGFCAQRSLAPSLHNPHCPWLSSVESQGQVCWESPIPVGHWNRKMSMLQQW